MRWINRVDHKGHETRFFRADDEPRTKSINHEGHEEHEEIRKEQPENRPIRFQVLHGCIVGLRDLSVRVQQSECVVYPSCSSWPSWFTLVFHSGHYAGIRMILIPAIDLRHGRVVRLQQGDYARETRGWEAWPASIGLGFFMRGEGIQPGPMSNFSSTRTFCGWGAGSTCFWIDPELDLTKADQAQSANALNHRLILTVDWLFCQRIWCLVEIRKIGKIDWISSKNLRKYLLG